ncbi:hypothetical protein L596_011394 [Steinernema carpocapsae]|uniref:Major facilitator superfamily (MFS) profile domain-containing protein n=1 Tax=Steinernema carpocapsae TaxID=34508 RepID=A0A4U5NUP4_STECR|nr:hypothetical protein L596_011394 [Steinernema carpocapsae]
MEDAEEIKEAVKAPKSNLGAFQNFGWYTGLICLVQEFLVLSQLSNMTFMIYGGYSPTVVSCGSTVFTGSDSERCLQLTVARNESDCEPQLEAQFGSVNYEFDLVCQDRILVKNSISIQMFGAMVGALVFGQVSDLFGRKKALMICLVGMLLFSMVSSCVGSLFAFTASRFFVMMFTGGLNSIQSVYIMENVPKKHRVWIPITISYSPNYIVFSIIAYFCGDWRSLTRVSSLVGNVPAILLLCFVHESPRWFVQKGRLEDARRTLIAIDAFNGTHTKKRLAEMEEGLEKEKMIFETQRRKKRYSFIHLFYTWKLTGYIFTLSFALMSASIINYALMFNMDKLSGSIYLNSVFFGFIRYAMNIFTAVFDYFGGHRSGRKVVHNGAMGVTATSLLFIFIVFIWNLRRNRLGHANRHALRLRDVFPALPRQRHRHDGTFPHRRPESRCQLYGDLEQNRLHSLASLVHYGAVMEASSLRYPPDHHRDRADFVQLVHPGNQRDPYGRPYAGTRRANLRQEEEKQRGRRTPAKGVIPKISFQCQIQPIVFLNSDKRQNLQSGGV